MKETGDLLRGDIRSYAFNTPRPSIYYQTFPEMHLWLLDRGEKNQEELLKLADEIIEQKKQSWLGMKKAVIEEIRPISDSFDSSNRPGFDQYYQALEVPWAEGFADVAGCLNECRIRGMYGLLKIPSVRAAVYGSLSTAYGQAFEQNLQQPGDAADERHLILASQAELFVTNDRRFLSRLKRRPLPGLDVMDLTTFVKKVI